MDKKELKVLYKKSVSAKIIVLCLSLSVAIILFFVDLSVGASGMSFFDMVRALFGGGTPQQQLIVRSMRLPRALAALIVGAGLGLSGCAMQSVLNNPIASPSTLGVGNAAAFGANFAIIVLGAGTINNTHGNWLSVSNPYLVSTCAFMFALAAVVAILLLTIKKKFGSTAILLAGVAVSSIFQAGTTLLQYYGSDTQVISALYWTFGDLSRATLKDCLAIGSVTVISFLYFYYKRYDYTVMLGGTAIAKSLGVNVKSTTVVTLFLASLITAVSVSSLGVIGFIGLIAPHITRRFVGGDYRWLLPCSAVCGSSVLLLADVLGRVALKVSVLPVGAITALIGGPMFLWLLLREKKDYEIAG
mgnify:FL=1